MKGGTYIQALSVRNCVCSGKSSYMGIADIGGIVGIHALVNGYIVGIASADIEMHNGIVHSLSYTYHFSNFNYLRDENVRL
ncbi:MAG: hypothetical protein ACLU4N_06130 [Butyricimonas faecihominis]